MVETLWCAEPVFGDAFIVAYGDILYEPSILKELLASPHAVSVVVDKDWRGYWQKRCENILDDAETLETDGAGRITSIGQKPDCPDQIQGQYIGLTMFKEEGVDILRSVYEDARRDGERGVNPLRGQRPHRMLYLTDILQGIIDWGFAVHEVPISRKWLEIDTLKDLKLAERAVDVHGEHFTITL
jgi:choline kinase